MWEGNHPAVVGVTLSDCIFYAWEHDCTDHKRVADKNAGLQYFDRNIIAIAAMLLFDQLFPALIAAGIPWVENSDANVRSKLAHERFTKMFNKTAFMLLKSIMFIAACNLWLWN